MVCEAGDTGYVWCMIQTKQLGNSIRLRRAQPGRVFYIIAFQVKQEMWAVPVAAE